MTKTAFVLKGYPRLSETFIAQEIRALEARGLEIEIVSLRHPTDDKRHPVHGEIAARVTYLPEYLYQEPLRVLRAWWRARRMPGYRAARRQWREDLARDLTPNRVRRFGQACVMAVEVAPRIDWIHAHFLHTPASVARYAALMTGRPWSVSAHAKDIYTSPDWEISEKLADCRWAVTCTAANREHLAHLSSDRKVGLVYHGLDLGRWPAAAPRPPRDGSDPEQPAVLLSIGRAVEKKGFEILIDALALLPAGLAWRLVHIGGGPRREALQHRAAGAGIADRIDWRGSRSQEEVLAACREADLFCLAPVIAPDGDRDGLPNVMMEAQSQGLAVAATRVSAVPELIEEGANGLLVAPGDAPALAAALERLIRDPALRTAMGAEGEARVRGRFAMDAGIDDLARRFGLS